MGDPVTWFDLGAANEAPLKAFYADLFGWKIEESSPGYTRISTGGGIPGGIGKSQSGEPWVTFYVDVPDPQATLDKAGSLGGRTVVPVTEFGPITFAMLTDLDGSFVGLTKASDEPMEGPQLGNGAPVDWFEVIGSDAKRSQGYYGELFGWTFDEMGGNYGLVRTGANRGIAGGVGQASDGRTWVTVYASVDDVEPYLAKAETLGGTREYGPVDVDDHMQSGALRDPAGNLFGVYHHADH